MPVMHIRKMRMAVLYHLVNMHMTVRLRRIPLKPMLMLMMPIMYMPMPMFRGFMHMLMGMPLRQVQPHAYGHQCRGNPERHAHRLAKYQQRHCGTEERCGGEISPGARTAQPA